MNLTSYLVVINDQTEDISNIQYNIQSAGSKIQLIIFNNQCKNESVISELKLISSIWTENTTPFIYTFSECVNEILRLSSGDFICVSREDALYSDDWLKKLIYTHNLIESSGVISIHDFSTIEGNYQLTKDNDILHWVYADDFRINNFAFFKKELIFKIGGFNTELTGKFAFWDFCERTNRYGFYNYFVPDTSMIVHSQYTDHFIEPNIKEYNKRKIQPFFKIFNLSDQAERDLKTLSKFSGGLYFDYHEKLGCIVFSKKDKLPISFISEIATTLSALNLDMDLYCSSYFENDLLKMSFIGLIKNKQ